MIMNKQLKNRSGGWVGFTKNLSMIAISILSRPFVLCHRKEFQQIILSKKVLYRHLELGPSRLKKKKRKKEKKNCIIADVEAIPDEWKANPLRQKPASTSISFYGTTSKRGSSL